MTDNCPAYVDNTGLLNQTGLLATASDHFYTVSICPESNHIDYIGYEGTHMNVTRKNTTENQATIN